MKAPRIVSVIGLGYVGLPVAFHFAKKYKTFGYDISTKRIDELKSGFDRTKELKKEELEKNKINFTSDLSEIKEANFHIVTVPTPINVAKQPDLTPLISASEAVGKILKKGDIVVYESTVYPGLTEEICLPILEKFSNLKGGMDFKIGYSPERINPGDTEHTFTKIKKVVSAQDEESLSIVAEMYGSVVEAGVFKAKSIKVAEASKVIENTQRDVNIALMNELAIIFNRIGIDTNDVLDAAATKWNFLKFKPGLVGGHCIGVDPYYLTHKAESLGYHPQMILSGRRINDGMGSFVVEKMLKEMILKGINVKESTISVLGLTFKENCPDLRNSKVEDIMGELKALKCHLQINDVCAYADEVKKIYNLDSINLPDLKAADALIVAAAHDEYKKLDFSKLLKTNGVLVDVKGLFDKEQIVAQGFSYWRL